jgi:hypothetical protein
MKSLLTYIEEGMKHDQKEKDKGPSIGPSAVDPQTQVMLNVAKANYPLAHDDDFAALATLVRRANKHSMDDDHKISMVHAADINANDLMHQRLHHENEVEDAAIAKLDQENDDEETHIASDEHRLDNIDKALIDLRRQIAVLLGKK